MFRRRSAAALACGMSLLAAATQVEGRDIVRTDRFIALESGERLFVREVRVREVRSSETATTAQAVLLVHGARVPGVGSFDLPVAGGSLASDLAGAGHAVYVLDLRGYGASSRPAAMEGAPERAGPQIRTADAVSDIGAAVDAIAAWSGDSEISLLGWATGGHWAGAYASRNPDKVERLIIYNSLYGGSERHATLGRGSPLEDRKNPGTFNTGFFGAYRLNSRESLFTAWDKSILVEDKAAWRDPAIASAYADAAFASDDTSHSREPPSFRSPSGAMADSFDLALDRRQWSAADLTMPVLIVRSGGDFWSRSEDARTLAAEAPRAKLLEIPNATHFVHLDRDRAGRSAFLSAVTNFLGGSRDAVR